MATAIRVPRLCSSLGGITAAQSALLGDYDPCLLVHCFQEREPVLAGGTAGRTAGLA
jgi:hypothetical protein